MSSTNKTENLHLNSWLGSDIPKREDFNADNSIIDSVVSEHHENSDIHTSAQEKNVWNSPYYISNYLGTGASSRTIEMECDFEPTWGIVFAVNVPSRLVDFTNEACYNYFSIVKNGVSLVTGVELDGTTLRLTQSGVPIFSNEYRSFNESGTVYFYIMFR